MGLVITIKEGESFKLGDDSIVTITKISGKNSKVHIEAPPEIRVNRIVKKRVQSAHGAFRDSYKRKLSPSMPPNCQ